MAQETFTEREFWANLDTAGEEKAQLKWKTEHSLAHRLMWKYLIYQQGCALGHSACRMNG